MYVGISLNFGTLWKIITLKNKNEARTLIHFDTSYLFESGLFAVPVISRG
jgi:hypothetical protein